jgi:hypothetical protein
MDYLTHWLITMVGAGLLGVIGFILQAVARHQTRKEGDHKSDQTVLDYKTSS